MQKNILIKVGFILVILIVLLLIVLNKSLQGKLFAWGVQMNLSDFKLINYSKDKTSVFDIERLEATDQTINVSILKTLTADHRKYIEDKKFLFNSLFLPITSPYPEAISNVIDCPDNFKPEAKGVEKGTIYSLYAGERYNYGICTKDLIKYNSKYGIFDCKQKGIFEILIFSKDKNKLDTIMQSFRC